MKISFGMIDAKDSEVIGIVGPMAKNLHNVKVMAKAGASYLNALLLLQRTIREEFEPALIENKPVDGEPEDWELDEAAYKEMGPLLAKGTNRLWYS